MGVFVVSCLFVHMMLVGFKKMSDTHFMGLRESNLIVLSYYEYFQQTYLRIWAIMHQN